MIGGTSIVGVLDGFLHGDSSVFQGPIQCYLYFGVRIVSKQLCTKLLALDGYLGISFRDCPTLSVVLSFDPMPRILSRDGG